MSVQIMSLAWKAKLGSHTRKIVLLALADNANDDGFCWPSLDTIQGKCDLSRQCVLNQIESLSESGILLVEKSHRRNNRYQILAGPLSKLAPVESTALTQEESSRVYRVDPVESTALTHRVYGVDSNHHEPSIKPSVGNPNPEKEAEQSASLKAAPSQCEAPHVPAAPPSKLEVLRLRVCKMVGRRPGTVWQEKEIAALKKVANLGTTEDEMAALEHRYASRNQFRRRDAYTLLNNWNCEVDRALQEKLATTPSGAGNVPSVFHPHQKLIDEIRGRLATHPADMERALDSGRQPTQEESWEYSQLRDKLAELMMDSGGGK